MRFFSLQQHSHSQSQCRPDFSVGSVTGPARGQRGGTAQAHTSFLSPGAGSADATNCICLKLDKACLERGKRMKVLTLEILL